MAPARRSLFFASSKSARPPALPRSREQAAFDASGRQIAAGKRGAIPADLAGILDRLGYTAEAWLGTMARGGAMLGTALGAPAVRHTFATRTGISWCADSSGLWVP